MSPSFVLLPQAVLDEQSKLQQAEAQIQARSVGAHDAAHPILPSCNVIGLAKIPKCSSIFVSCV